jgi:hypothetical protein
MLERPDDLLRQRLHPFRRIRGHLRDRLSTATKNSNEFVARCTWRKSVPSFGVISHDQEVTVALESDSPSAGLK